MSGEAVKRKKFGKGKGKKVLLDEHTETNGVTPGGRYDFFFFCVIHTCAL